MDNVFFIENNEKPLYVRLYDAITKEIYEGSLKSDEKMPSIRQLSKSMNISRTTIETTYSQLVAEGFLYSRPQKGYFVMALDFSMDSEESDNDQHHNPRNRDNPDQLIKTYDFVSEYVEYTNFDIMNWKKNINKVLYSNENELFSFSNPFGEEELKQEIAKYFTRVRGIQATSSQVVIGAGTQSLLRALSILFYEKNFKTLSIENPGFNLAKDVFSQSGYKLNGISLKNSVLDIRKLSEEKQQILFTSPSYQFPFGEIMTMQSRYQLLNWARRTNSYIIEDDYNNELRYIGKPVPSLQGIDTNNRVVYLGSFSTLLIPSIRISFMVLPINLLKEYEQAFSSRVQSASKLEQLALANMLSSGDFAKHIRKLRKNYKNKHQKLSFYVNKHLSQLVNVELPPAGASAIITLNKEVEITKINLYSEKYNLKISLLSDFIITKSPKLLEKYLVLNYRGINEYDMEDAIIKIKELICQLY